MRAQQMEQSVILLLLRGVAQVVAVQLGLTRGSSKSEATY
jgi:hypothetical protein